MKRYLSLFLCVCLVLALCACTSKQQTFESLTAEAATITEGETEGAFKVLLDKEALADGAMKIAYIAQSGSLDGYVKDQTTFDEMLSQFEIIPDNIAVKFSGVADEEYSAKGNVTFEFGDASTDMDFMMDMKSGIYIGVAGMVDFVYELVQLIDAESLGGLEKEALLEAFSEYDYIEMNFEELGVAEQYKKMSELDYTKMDGLVKATGKFIDKYLANNIVSTSDGCTVTFKLSTLKADILKFCEIIDSNPGAFFDDLAKIVIEYRDTGVFETLESEDMSFSEVLDAIDEFLESREEFIESWNEENYRVVIDEAFAEFETNAMYQLLENTEMVWYAGKEGDSFVEKVEMNFCIDSTEPCISIVVDSSTRKADIPLLSEQFKAENPVSITEIEEVFSQKLIEAYMAAMMSSPDTVA